MNTVTDAFLLELAGIVASLLGFFVIGVFFYVQRGMFPQAADKARHYLREAIRSVIVLFGMTLFLSLALVVLAPGWVSFLYLSLSLVLIWSVARTSGAIRSLHRVLSVRVSSQTVLWIAAIAIVALPWALGGTQPSRDHLSSATLLMGVLAFTSSASLVLSAFDIARLEAISKGAEDEALAAKRNEGSATKGEEIRPSKPDPIHVRRLDPESQFGSEEAILELGVRPDGHD